MAVELKSDMDKMSYALGMNISASVLQLPLEVNRELIIAAGEEIRAGLLAHELRELH